MPKYKITIKTSSDYSVVIEANDMLNALDAYNHGDHDEPIEVVGSHLLYPVKEPKSIQLIGDENAG